jgi:nucleoside-diphosphate-sugar epimerase
VVALVRTPARVKDVEALGARAVVADALDQDGLRAAIRRAAPETVIHELTSLKGVTNFRRFDQDFALTNRFRTRTLDTMLAASRSFGARRFIAQSYCGWPYAREGSPVKTEDDPLDPNPPASFRESLAAIRHLEDTIRQMRDIEAVALRYGNLYGPGTDISDTGAVIHLVSRRRLPLFGSGAGIWSFIHVRDAASATVAAMSRGSPGIYNVVDDDPAPVNVWLPALANALGARPPRRLPAWLGALLLGEGGLSMMTLVRGGSNAKAKRELGWQPSFASWRRGFVEGLA